MIEEDNGRRGARKGTIERGGDQSVRDGTVQERIDEGNETVRYSEQRKVQRFDRSKRQCLDGPEQPGPSY